MEVVLGVSLTSDAIYRTLTEGDRALGVAVEQDAVPLSTTDSTAAAQVVATILEARVAAAEGDYRLTSIGVTCTGQADTVALSDALAEQQISDVMLVSGFLAAAALTQTVGRTLGYPHIALVYADPASVTLAVVDSATGAIGAVHRRGRSGDIFGLLGETAAELAALETRPGGVYLIGSAADITALKPQLEMLVPLPVSVPEEPTMALAQGAAVAAAHAPLFRMSTEALAYSKDPGTGVVDPDGLALSLADDPGGVVDPDAPVGLAYSAVPGDPELAEETGRIAVDVRRSRRPLLIGSGLGVVVVIAAVALMISLALQIQPVARLLPNPGGAVVLPAEPAPPPQTIPQPAPVVQQVPPEVAAPPPVVQPQPQIVVPAPELPATPPVPEFAVPPAVAPVLPQAPAPVAPMPQVPIPVPEVPAPQAPVPVPIPVPIVVPQFPVFEPPAPKVRPRDPVVQAPQPPVRQPKQPDWQPKAPEVPRWQPKAPELPRWQPKDPEVPRWQPKEPELPQWQPKAPEVPRWQPKAPELPQWQPKAPQVPRWQPKAPAAPKLPLPDLRFPF